MASTSTKVKIRTGLGENKTLDFALISNETVGTAKERLHKDHKVGEKDRQRWFWNGVQLKDETSCGEIGVGEGHVVQCILKPEEKKETLPDTGGPKPDPANQEEKMTPVSSSSSPSTQNKEAQK